jgi:hypothetical protein
MRGPARTVPVRGPDKLGAHPVTRSQVPQKATAEKRLRLREFDGYLDPTLPTALLYVENRTMSEGFFLHRLWADK